jgi:predicted DNA-binding transcriptional regulator AlpA
MEKYLTTEEVSELTRFSESTLKKYRGNGRGPRFLSVEGSIRYRESDVRAWMEAIDGETESQEEE